MEKVCVGKKKRVAQEIKKINLSVLVEEKATTDGATATPRQ